MVPVALLQNMNARCDQATNTLCLPLQDADGRTVGFKTLRRKHEDLVETTFPETNCFGVLMSSAVGKSSSKDVGAVVVLNVPDLLALTMQKLNSKSI